MKKKLIQVIFSLFLAGGACAASLTYTNLPNEGALSATKQELNSRFSLVSSVITELSAGEVDAGSITADKTAGMVSAGQNASNIVFLRGTFTNGTPLVAFGYTNAITLFVSAGFDDPRAAAFITAGSNAAILISAMTTSNFTPKAYIGVDGVVTGKYVAFGYK